MVVLWYSTRYSNKVSTIWFLTSNIFASTQTKYWGRKIKLTKKSTWACHQIWLKSHVLYVSVWSLWLGCKATLSRHPVDIRVQPYIGTALVPVGLGVKWISAYNLKKELPQWRSVWGMKWQPKIGIAWEHPGFGREMDIRMQPGMGTTSCSTLILHTQ